jgi:hypothetical protein
MNKFGINSMNKNIQNNVTMFLLFKKKNLNLEKVCK